MNDYFVTKRELEEALAEERDRLFTAIGKALWQLEHKISLLVNVGIKERFPEKEIKEGEKMSEKKIKALMERLWLVADKLDNAELIIITTEIEACVEKTTSNLKKFNDELKGLLGRVKALEEKRAD